MIKNYSRLVFELSVAKLSTYLLKVLHNTIPLSRYPKIDIKISESFVVNNLSKYLKDSDIKTKC